MERTQPQLISTSELAPDNGTNATPFSQQTVVLTKQAYIELKWTVWPTFKPVILDKFLAGDNTWRALGQSRTPSRISWTMKDGPSPACKLPLGGVHMSQHLSLPVGGKAAGGHARVRTGLGKTDRPGSQGGLRKLFLVSTDTTGWFRFWKSSATVGGRVTAHVSFPSRGTI